MIDKLNLIPASYKPGDDNMLNPDMQLSCLYCSKLFKPYNNLVNDDFAFMAFCSPRHYQLHHSWFGKIKRFFEDLISTIYHRPKFRIISWFFNHWAPICKDCGTKMNHQYKLDKDHLFFCEDDDCDSFTQGLYKFGWVNKSNSDNGGQVNGIYNKSYEYE